MDLIGVTLKRAGELLGGDAPLSARCCAWPLDRYGILL